MWAFHGYTVTSSLIPDVIVETALVVQTSASCLPHTLETSRTMATQLFHVWGDGWGGAECPVSLSRTGACRVIVVKSSPTRQNYQRLL